MAGKPLLASWRADVPASIVVSLIALPLCLGVALASGAPLFSGLIAGIAGGLVVGAISKSPLSVSGPAAGLTVIVLAAIEGLPSYQAFLAAVAIAGVLQILFAVTKAGVASEFIPSAVITGMLAAIGLTLILKQIPHAVGYDAEAEGSLEFLGPDGANTFSDNASGKHLVWILPPCCLASESSSIGAFHRPSDLQFSTLSVSKLRGAFAWPSACPLNLAACCLKASECSLALECWSALDDVKFAGYAGWMPAFALSDEHQCYRLFW